MRPLLALTGVLLVALVGVGSAQADYVGPNPIGASATDATEWATIVQNLSGTSSTLATGETVTEAAATAISDAEVTGAFVPALSSAVPAIGVVAIGAAAIYTSYKLGGAIARELGFYAAEAQPAPTCAGASLTNPQYVWPATVGAYPNTAVGNGWETPNTGYELIATAACTTPATTVTNAGFGIDWTAGFSSHNCYGLNNDSVLNAADSFWLGANATHKTKDILVSGSNHCFYRYTHDTAAQMQAHVHMRVRPCSSTGTNCAGLTQVATLDPPTTSSCSYTSTCASDIRAKLAEGSDATDTEVGHIVDPNWAGTSFTLPKPNVNETYSAYITRLQGLGYAGATSTPAESIDLSGYGPNAVTRVVFTDPATGSQRVLDPLNWPSTAVSIGTLTALTVRHNSASSTPAPTDGNTTTCGTTANPCVTTIQPSTATPGTIDFSPLTSISFGCKFPYGVFCYASTVTGWFDTTAIAPEFNFSIPKPHLPGASASTLSYDVNMDDFDPYMAMIRAIETVILWVGAVWMFCTRILGIQWGDPGEAIDDAIPGGF